MLASHLVSMNPLRLAFNLFRHFFSLSNKKFDTDGLLSQFQVVLGYKFKSEELLKLSLTHKSMATQEDIKGIMSNERLEFLGDAVLNCLVTEYLYLTNPDKSEGQLSKIKSLVVSRKILGEIAIALDLGKYLIFGLSEEKSGGRNRASTLSNAFEAVLGALYLDGGLKASKALLQKVLFGRIPEFLNDKRNINYKSKILEMSQKDGFGIPKYKTLEMTGPDHAKEFKICIEIADIPMGEGIGTNKKIAQQNAAQIATLNYSKEEITSRLKEGENNELVSN